MMLTGQGDVKPTMFISCQLVQHSTPNKQPMEYARRAPALLVPIYFPQTKLVVGKDKH